jgi:hypothetical protein
MTMQRFQSTFRFQLTYTTFSLLMIQMPFRAIYLGMLLYAWLGMVGCQKEVQIDTDQVQPRFVIDGLVTNIDTNHVIRITRSKSFNDKGDNPAIENAQVEVSDGTQTYRFTHEGAGNYRSERFAGVIGKTYLMRIVIDGQVFTAQEELRPVSPVDSLKWTVDPDNQQNPPDSRYPDRYYEMTLYAIEPQDRIDYYQFRFYRNGEKINDSGNDVFIAEDKFFSERIDGIECPGFYTPGDTGRAEMYSISRDVYLFYSDLNTVLNTDGGMFGPIPANPRSNISNGALGLFQVSAVSSRSVVIGR